MPPTAVRLASFCALVLPSAQAALGLEGLGREDQSALFQRDLRLDPSTLEAEPRTGGLNVSSILPMLDLYAHNSTGRELLASVSAVFQTATAVAERLRTALESSLSSGTLDFHVMEAALHGPSQSLTNLGRLTGTSARSGGKGLPGFGTPGSNNITENAVLTFYVVQAAGSDEFMHRADEFWAAVRSQFQSLSEAAVWAVDGLVTDCRNASSTEVMWFMTEAMNEVADSMKEMVATLVDKSRRLLESVPKSAEPLFASFGQTISMSQAVIHSPLFTSYKLLPGGLTQQQFCSVMDVPMAASVQFKSGSADMLKGLESAEGLLGDIRHMIQRVDPARTQRVVYLIASAIDGMTAAHSQMDLLQGKLMEVLALLQQHVECELPKLKAAQAAAETAQAPASAKAAAAAAHSPEEAGSKSSGTARVAGPRRGVWPLFAATFLLASVLSL